MNVRDVAVIGAGIIGAAVARQLCQDLPGARVSVFEKEDRPAAHQTGHNSGVVHAGLYYEPGGLKARLCRRGHGLLEALCREKRLPYERCGKIVVALHRHEEARLRAIFDRATANGVPDVTLLGPEGIRDVEPNAVGRLALHSPHTAITDYAAVTRALLQDVVTAGGVVRYGTHVHRISVQGARPVVHTNDGPQGFDRVVTCAGLQSDRLARASGAPREPTIVPFFGQYLMLKPAYRDYVKGLIYPVPDPQHPFLGVHLTRRIDGETLVGPNAFLSPSRERYEGFGVNVRDIAAAATDRGLWRFAAHNLPTALQEIQGVISEQHFMSGAQRYVPLLGGASTVRATRGIRAQAMDSSGELLDDFAIQHFGPITHVRNAPSPGATSSMAIAEHIVAGMRLG